MPTRISGACNGCRSKKQKCSGDRSGCSQCEAAGIPCTWPQQRKRGPAKGYIEGLEHRLHEAETLLLQVLPHVSEQQLEQITADIDRYQCPANDSPDGHASPPALNKKIGIDYWETFPLTTVTDIRRWQQDCHEHSTSKDITHTDSKHYLSPNLAEATLEASRPARTQYRPRTQEGHRDSASADLRHEASQPKQRQSSEKRQEVSSSREESARVRSDDSWENGGPNDLPPPNDISSRNQARPQQMGTVQETLRRWSRSRDSASVSKRLKTSHVGTPRKPHTTLQESEAHLFW